MASHSTPFTDRVHAAYAAAILRFGADLDSRTRNAACAVARVRLHRCLAMARALDASCAGTLTEASV